MHACKIYSKLLSALLLVISVTSLSGQLNEKGRPYSLGKSSVKSILPMATMDQIDMVAVQAEDAINDEIIEIPYRFGIEHTVDLGLDNAGLWEDLPNGDRLWRLVLNAPKAKSINLVYDVYDLPKGAKLFLYNETYEQILGAFTARNNKSDKSFSTALLYGEKTYIEYYEPAAVKGQGRLHINMVVHSYRSIFDKNNAQLGNSGGCNIDTECPQGDQWRDQIKAAGKTIAGGGLCSGTLVGNTTGDRRPLFLSANHCGFANTVVVYWRFERPNCGSGTPDDTQTTSGATLLADVDGAPGGTIRNSDHLLMELSENPSDLYDVYYAGWDARGDIAQSVTGIHHPAGDAKKISMENEAVTSTAYLQTPVNPDATHWRVADWDSGTTEGGSSGSALFDNATGRLVGMLSGGFAACGNDSDDWYGKFSFAWENNDAATANRRLRDWLDPNNSGILTIDGYGLSDITLTAPATDINVCIDSNASSIDFDLEVVAGFSGTVNFSVSGLPSGVNSSFSSNNVSTSGTYQLNLTGISSATPGDYNIVISAADGTDTEMVTIMYAIDEQLTTSTTLLSPADVSSDVSVMPDFQWTDIAAEYEIEIATDIGFSNIIETATVSTNSYTGGPLSTVTTYFWRVTPSNACGGGPTSQIFRFQTANIACLDFVSSDTPIVIPTAGTPTITSTIVVADAGVITDLNILNLNIQHTWIADLTVTITHVESSTSAALFITPCNNEDNIIGDFDDDGGTLPCPPNGGTFAPAEAFSIFNGVDIAETWVLTVADGANLDGGSLESWTLNICGTVPSNATCDDMVMNGDEEGVDCGGTLCTPCETCTDGIQNGDEDGVDCGGSFCAACPCTDIVLVYDGTASPINIPDGTDRYVRDYIDAHGEVTVEAGTLIQLRAGQFIEVMADFEVEQGGELLLDIANCDDQ